MNEKYQYELMFFYFNKMPISCLCPWKQPRNTVAMATFLEKWLIPRLGVRRYKINLGHLVPEARSWPLLTTLCQKDTGASLRVSLPCYSATDWLPGLKPKKYSSRSHVLNHNFRLPLKQEKVNWGVGEKRWKPETRIEENILLDFWTSVEIVNPSFLL